MNNPANPAASSKPRHPPAHEWDELREALDASETESRPPYNVLGVAAKIGVASFLAANALLVPFLFGAFRRNAIPFVTTSDAKTRAILTALESQIFKVDNGLCIPPKQGSQFNFIDLGSGDGRVVIAASRDRKLAFTNCVGVEINSVLLGASLVKEKVDYVVRWIRRAEDLDSMAKVRFLKRDFWNLNLAPYQVVMVFGDLRLMVNLDYYWYSHT
ncbi:hypothetical protein BC830DRAFT_1173345 [Chytriomyces sp. MP71]|nr:hypothetical protein BC830DRAFT_1173345 [Chytriomyces sp. MP71]